MSVRRLAGLLLAAAALPGGYVALAPQTVGGTPPRSDWVWRLPDTFPVPRVPKDNALSTAKVEAGKRLFYDRRLSANAKQSCSSCHRPELAFTDGKQTAVGSTGEAHPRNSQSLVNVAYSPTLTWANPALVTLERQMEVPLFGERPVEMGVTDNNKGRVLARIKHDTRYRQLFTKAFPGRRQPVTWQAIVRSIAAFERTLISADSKYDRYVRGEAKLTASERRGQRLFSGEEAECHHCHGTFLFNDQATYAGAQPATPEFHNNGLYNLGGTGAYPEGNRGVYELTGDPADMGMFRAPSLRNVALTAPYMHDGSIATLREVVDHYAAGGRTILSGPFAGDGRQNPNKDPLLAGIDLTEQDRDDLVAFLRTLTDTSIAKNPRFADPFR
ncbi:MAG: MbnH family di-heme enzyme [Baekduia sp.]